MSDHIDKMEAILHRMETERLAAKAQLEMYMATIDKTISMYDKRADTNDSRFSTLRGYVVSIIIFVLGVTITGGIGINSSLDKKLESGDIKEMDLADTKGVLHGNYSVIEDLLEVIQDNTDLEKQDADDYEIIIKRKAYREVTGEVTRNIQ